MRHRLRFAAIAAALVCVATPCTVLGAQGATRQRASRDSLTVTFLANEGVMLSAAGATVIIDGLSGEGLEGYGVVSPANRRLLERALPPFDRVNAVLTTHIHRDHFDAPAVLAHLRANPRATFVSTTEAVERVRSADAGATAGISTRMRGVALPKGERRQVATAGGATIYALGLPHGQTRNRAANIGFVVDIGGFRALHIGDTSAGLEEFSALRLGELGIDVALLPSWYLSSAELGEVIRREIRPRSIVILHGPPLGEGTTARSRAQWREMVRDAQAEFPNARAFTRELETMVFR